MFQVIFNIQLSLKTVTYKVLAWESYSKPQEWGKWLRNVAVAHHGEIQGAKTKQRPNQHKQSGLIDHGLPEEYNTTNLIQGMATKGVTGATGLKGACGVGLRMTVSGPSNGSGSRAEAFCGKPFVAYRSLVA